MKMHYSGGLVIRDLQRVRTWAPGYPLCCYGDRAIAIRRQGNHTNAKSMVTCRTCKRILTQAPSSVSES